MISRFDEILLSCDIGGGGGGGKRRRRRRGKKMSMNVKEDPTLLIDTPKTDVNCLGYFQTPDDAAACIFLKILFFISFHFISFYSILFL